MKKLPHCLAAGLFVTAISSVFAQTSDDAAGGHRRGGPGGPGHRPGGHPIVRTLDTDHNHEISAAELAAAPAAIRALDTNGDGIISAGEMRPARPTPPADAPARTAGGETPGPRGARGDRPHLVDPVMMALDADANGSLSSTEISNASTSLAALDGNKDGKLTIDELRPLPPVAN